MPIDKPNSFISISEYLASSKLFKTAKFRSIQLLCGEGTRDVKKITKTKSANANGTKPYLFIIF